VGVRRVAFEAVAVAGLVVDLAAADAERMPATAAQVVEIEGVQLPRQPVPAGSDALAIILAMLHSEAT
jgi:HPr kinase/phosphorylase